VLLPEALGHCAPPPGTEPEPSHALPAPWWRAHLRPATAAEGSTPDDNLGDAPVFEEQAVGAPPLTRRDAVAVGDALQRPGELDRRHVRPKARRLAPLEDVA